MEFEIKQAGKIKLVQIKSAAGKLNSPILCTLGKIESGILHTWKMNLGHQLNMHHENASKNITCPQLYLSQEIWPTKIKPPIINTP